MLRNMAPQHCYFKQYRRRNPKLQAALREISSSRIRSNPPCYAAVLRCERVCYAAELRPI